MSSTDKNPATSTAEALFDSAVVPLAAARRAAGNQAYFPLQGLSGETTFFQPPILRVMQPADFEFPGGGTANGLIDALASKWEADGETELAAMGPRLKEIAAESETAAIDGSVSVLCYTMF